MNASHAKERTGDKTTPCTSVEPSLRNGTDTSLHILRWIGGAVFVVVAFTFVGFIVLFNVALLWIRYQPLPPLPLRNVAYTVTDTGKTVPGVFWFKTRDARESHSGGYDSAKTYYRLSADGAVKVLTEGDGVSDLARREEARRVAAKRLGIEHGEHSDRVIDMARNGSVFARNGRDSRVYRGNKPGPSLPGKVRGYRWDHHCGTAFFAVNGRGEVIGNERIATACASSGGTSEPHGRDLPLLWRSDNRLPEDMNTLIPPADGWYLYHALDLNERGQVLCLAAKRRLRDAETHPKMYRLVVLTPITPSPQPPPSSE